MSPTDHGEHRLTDVRRNCVCVGLKHCDTHGRNVLFALLKRHLQRLTDVIAGRSHFARFL